MKIKEILKLLSIPLTLMIIYLSMALLWKLFNFPNPEELVNIITNYFNSYGLWIVFISALIEGFLLLGQYFPGGFIIFLGVLSAGSNIIRASNVVLIVSIAFFISYYGNYLLGKYGWYKLFEKFGLKKSLDNAQRRLNKHGFKAVIFSYWEPNLASITATAAGILHLPTKVFLLYSAIGIIAWNSFWGILIFNMGKAALQLTGLKYVTIIFFIWIVMILITEFIRRKLTKNNLKENLN